MSTIVHAMTCTDLEETIDCLGHGSPKVDASVDAVEPRIRLTKSPHPLFLNPAHLLVCSPTHRLTSTDSFSSRAAPNQQIIANGCLMGVGQTQSQSRF